MRLVLAAAISTTVALAASLAYGERLFERELCWGPPCLERFFEEASSSVGILGWWISAWGLVIAVLKLGMAERSLKAQADSASASHGIGHFEHFSAIVDGWVGEFEHLRQVSRANVQIHARLFPWISILAHGDGPDASSRDMIEKWAASVRELNEDCRRGGRELPGLHEKRHRQLEWCRWMGFFVSEDLDENDTGRVEVEVHILMNWLLQLAGSKTRFPGVVEYR